MRGALGVLLTALVVGGQSLFALGTAGATSVSQPTVALSDSTYGHTSQYTITFTPTTDLAPNQFIEVDASQGAPSTVFPFGAAYYVVQQGTNQQASPSMLGYSGNTVEFETPFWLYQSKPVVLTIENVTNPIAPTPDATLQLYTQADTTPITSAPYAITALGASASLTPDTLAFGTTPVNTPATDQTVTVTNDGSTSLPVSYTFTGPNKADFSSPSTTCTGTLASGASCDIAVEFDPLAAGAAAASLLVSFGGRITDQTVSLTGTGGVPAVEINPSSVNFGSVPLGATSPTQTVTLTNSGDAPLTIASDTVADSRFSIVTDSCALSTVQPQGSCTVVMTFTPIATDLPGQSYGGTLVFSDSAAGSPQTVALSGTVSAAAAYALAATPSGVDFGSQQVGSSAPNKVVTITNVGQLPVTLPPAAALISGTGAADFSLVSDGCSGLTLSPGQYCSVSVGFTPVASGTLGAVLTVSNGGAPAVATKISLSGVGIGPSIVISPPSFDFGTVGQGTLSSPAQFTVSNLGSAAASLTSATLTPGDFHIVSGSCLPTLAPGTSCVVTVDVQPTGALGTQESAVLALTYGTAPPSPSVTTVTADLTVTVGPPPAPAMSVSPLDLSFPATAVGSQSAPEKLVVTNSGSAPLSFSSTSYNSLSGPFSVSADGCAGQTLQPGNSCTVWVIFAPTGVGVQNGSVRLEDTALQTTTISLSGAGTGPAAGVSPSSIDFGTVGAGLTSPPRTLTVADTGSAPLTIGTVALGGNNPGQFTILSDACSGNTIQPGDSCKVRLEFAPSSSATPGSTFGATLTIPDNAPGSSPQVTLTGTVGTPAVSFSPASVGFGTVGVGVSSAPETVTVTNSGSSALSVSSLALGGTNPLQFAITGGTCGSGSVSLTLAPGASCTVQITFDPTVAGPMAAELVVTDDASSSPQSVELTGTASAPSVAVSPPSIDFGQVGIGSTSPDSYVTVTNNGSAAVTFTSLSLSSLATTNGFSLDSSGTTCSTSTPLASGASCTIALYVDPTSAATLSGLLVIDDSASSSPQSVDLSVTGVGPAVSLSSSSYDFGAVADGSTSPTHTFTVTNTGLAPLQITSVAATTGDTAQFGAPTGSCVSAGSVTVQPGASCTINVDFAPTRPGALAEELTIIDNAASSPQSIELSGYGLAPAVALSPPTVNFGSVPEGTVSSTRMVTLTNTGGAPLAVTNVATSGGDAAEFQIVSDSCSGNVIEPAGSCTVVVDFQPGFGDTPGTAYGTSLVFSDNAPGGPQSVALVGTAAQPLQPAVTVTPNPVNFGATVIGVEGSVQTVTVTNTGAAPLAISGVTIAGVNAADFTIVTNSCTNVDPGMSCTLQIQFTPSAADAGLPGESAVLQLTDNAPDSPQDIPLLGIGVGPEATVTPTTGVNFGTVGLGVPTVYSQTITITNTGAGRLDNFAFSLGGSGASAFSINDTNCTATGSYLAPGQSCTVDVTFAPSAAGTYSGQLEITDNSIGAAQGVTLYGTATWGTALVSTSTGSAGVSGTTSVAFPSTAENTQSLGRFVKVTNVGIGSLNFNGTPAYTIVGPEASSFKVVADSCTGAVLPPAGNGASTPCTFTVVFAPTSTGLFSATLFVTDNSSAGSPQSVLLTGVAVGPKVRVSPASLDFGKVVVHTISATKWVVVTNVGSAKLLISKLVLFGPGRKEYRIVIKTCVNNQTLSPGATCTVGIQFRPTRVGRAVAVLKIRDNAPGMPQVVRLLGYGVPPSPPPVEGQGYLLAAADGGVFAFGPGAAFHGSLLSAGEPKPTSPVVGIAALPHDAGYWLVDSIGHIYPFGKARSYGGLNRRGLSPVVAIIGLPNGTGYYLITSTGNVFCFGKVHNYGSLAHVHLPSPIVGGAYDQQTGGYWLVAKDGQVYPFHARQFGDLHGVKLRSPVVGMSSAAGRGYWLVTASGEVFGEGQVPFVGRLSGPPSAPVVAIVTSPGGDGYWLVTSKGQVVPFGRARYWGEAVAIALNKPMTSATP